MLLTIAFIAFFVMLVAWITMPNNSELPVAKAKEELAPSGTLPNPVSA